MERKMCFDFLYEFSLKQFSEILSKMYTSSCKVPHILVRFLEPLFEKYSNIKIHENLSSGS